MRRFLSLGLGLALVAVAGTACLTIPGTTSQINLVSSTTVNGWKYDFFRTSACPCSISGYQTFVVRTKWDHPRRPPRHWGSGCTEGESATSTRRELHNPTYPDDKNSAASSRRHSPTPGYRPTFRLIRPVSECGRLLLQPRHLQRHRPDRSQQSEHEHGRVTKTTNGLQATKAAIAFTESTYPTSKYFLAGGSAGSAARICRLVGTTLREPAAGVVGDASVVNVEEGTAAYQQGVCRNGNFDPNAEPIISQRLDPQIADVNNEVDKLVASGQLTVPLLHIWNHADTNTCGSTPMQCPIRDGSVVTMGATDCDHQPLAAAITARDLTPPLRTSPLRSVAGHAWLFASRRHDTCRLHQLRSRQSFELPCCNLDLGGSSPRRSVTRSITFA